MAEARRRVCLDCGTPKMPQRDKCIPCKKVTLTHTGQARDSICKRCKFVFIEDDGSFDCGWARNNNPHMGHRVIDGVLDRSVDYFYSCPDFKQSQYKTYNKSPNPLTFAEQRDIRDFLTLGAFWLDPYLWEEVDAHKDDVWAKQAARAGGSSHLVAAGVVAAAGLLLLKTLFKPSPPSTVPANACSNASLAPTSLCASP